MGDVWMGRCVYGWMDRCCVMDGGWVVYDWWVGDGDGWMMDRWVSDEWRDSS